MNKFKARYIKLLQNQEPEPNAYYGITHTYGIVRDSVVWNWQETLSLSITTALKLTCYIFNPGNRCKNRQLTQVAQGDVPQVTGFVFLLTNLPVMAWENLLACTNAQINSSPD